MMKSVIASICFNDNRENHVRDVLHLMELYQKCEGTADMVKIEIGIEDDNLVIDVSKGFHCLHIPLDELKILLEAKNAK